MANTEVIAANWVNTLGTRPELPFAEELGKHFAKARIKRLCDCGCNSFECLVAEGVTLKPLFSAWRGLSSFELAFASDGEDPIDVVIYSDERGYLSGIDVHYGLSNHAPMPSNARLGQLLFSTPAL